MHQLLDVVVLTRDLPESGLRRGDLGTIVECHDGDAFEVELVAASGRTQALLTLALGDVGSVDDRDLIAVRSLAESAA